MLVTTNPARCCFPSPKPLGTHLFFLPSQIELSSSSSLKLTSEHNVLTPLFTSCRGISHWSAPPEFQMRNEDFRRSDKSGPFNLSRGLNSAEEVVFALNAFALLLCRSLLGGGFDKANDVMSTAFLGPVGAGWFKYHLISHITTHTRWWFLSEFAVADSLSSYLVSPRLASFPLADFEPQKGMDRYLDSLFDPVLSEGSEVRYIIHSLRHTWPPERGFFGQQFTFTASYCTAALSSIFNEPPRSKNKKQ